ASRRSFFGFVRIAFSLASLIVERAEVDQRLRRLRTQIASPAEGTLCVSELLQREKLDAQRVLRFVKVGRQLDGALKSLDRPLAIPFRSFLHRLLVFVDGLSGNLCPELFQVDDRATFCGPFGSCRLEKN